MAKFVIIILHTKRKQICSVYFSANALEAVKME